MQQRNFVIMKLLKKLVEMRKKGKGFLNKKGGFWNYSELHAIGLGGITYGMAYLLDIPYGRELIFATGLGALGVKGFRKFSTALHDDILDQSHYFLLSCGIVEATIQLSPYIKTFVRGMM